MFGPGGRLRFGECLKSMKYLLEFDWATTPLGAKESWSPALRSVYEMMMASGFAMFATWGPERTFIYNEAYFPFLGARHPEALGKPIEQVWPEIWHDIGPIFEKALAGEATYVEDMHLVMTRNGVPEDTWWTFSYSPLREDGKVMGVLDVATDRTDTVLLKKAMQARTEQLVESEARLLKLTTAGAYSLYRMSPDWLEMKLLEGHGILADTPNPTVKWLDVYIDEEDRPHIFSAIQLAISTKSTFELEHRVKAIGGGFGWVLSRAVPILNDDGEILEWFGAATDITARRKAEAQQEVINHEISHRLKNVLSVVQSIVSQTIRFSPDMASAQAGISSRLNALSRAQDVLTSGSTDSLRLHRLIETALDQHADGNGRIAITGPDVMVGSSAALNLTLMINELATNAVKYGSLSQPDGKVSVEWSVSGTPLCLHLKWQETGGPPVSIPTHKGFGSRLTERSLVGGESRLSYDSAGLIFELDVALSNLLDG